MDEKQSLTDHLAALVERLRPYAEGIAKVSAWPTTHGVTLWVAEHMISENPEVRVEPEDLGAIAAMKAELGGDLHFYGAEDE